MKAKTQAKQFHGEADIIKEVLDVCESMGLVEMDLNEIDKIDGNNRFLNAWNKGTFNMF